MSGALKSQGRIAGPQDGIYGWPFVNKHSIYYNTEIFWIKADSGLSGGANRKLTKSDILIKV
jgi:hypothetical protein